MATNAQVMELLITSRNETSADFAKVKADLASIGTQVTATNAKIAESGAASDAASAGVTKHASTYLRLGVAMGLVGGAIDALGVKSATNLDTAEHHVMALTNAIGTGINQIPLAKLETQIRSLSDETGVSTTKITEGFYSVASADLTAAKSMEVLREGSKFAAASQTDQTIALGLLTSVTKAYGLSIQQIKQYQDDITQAVKLGTMEARDYAPALAQNIPLAHQLGVNLKELGAMYIVLTNNGLSAAQAGVEVGNTLTKLLNPTFQQVQAIKLLHGTMADFKVVNGDVIGTLSHLNDLLTKAVPDVRSLENAHGDLTRRQEIFVEQMKNSNSEVARLFGGNTQAMRLFFALMANGGDQARAALRGMQNDSGATDKAFRTMADSAEMQFKRMTVAFDQAGQALGKSLLPQLKSIEGVLKPAAGATGDFLRQHQEMTAILGDTVIGIGLLTASYYANQLVIRPLVTATGEASGALRAIVPAAAAARTALVEMEVVGVGAMAALSAAAGVALAAFVAERIAFYNNEHIAASNAENVSRGQKQVEDAFVHSKISIDQATAALDKLKQFASITHTPLAELTKAQLQAAKAAWDHAHGIIALNDAINILGQNNVGGFGGNVVGMQRSLPPTAQGQGGGPTPFDVEKVLRTTEQNIYQLGAKIINDTEQFGAHSKQVAADRADLDTNMSTYRKYRAELDALTNITGKLKDTQTAAEREYTAAQQKLQDAQVQAAADMVHLGYVTTAHAAALASAKSKADAFQNALDGLTGKTHHVASALEQLNAAALKGQDLPAMYDAAAAAQQRLTEKSNKLADVFAEVERRAGDYSAYLSQFNKKLQDALSSAEGKLAYDEKHHPGDKSLLASDTSAITLAQQRVNAWSDSVGAATGAAKGFSYVLSSEQTKLQDALSTAEGKLIADEKNRASAGTIAADKKAITEANARLNAFNKQLSDLTPSTTHLESAANKAAKALEAFEKVVRYHTASGAEDTARAGQFKQIGQPPGFGGTDNISLIEQRINNISPTDFSSEGAYEKAVQHLFSLLDAAITAYGNKTQSAFDKAAAAWEKNPANVGSDAWFKKQDAAYQKLLKSPEITSGVANIVKDAGFAQGGTFGGTAAASQKSATDFQNQVNLGVLAARNADRQTLVGLKTAQTTGDTGTAFTDLQNLYLQGKNGLDGLVVTLPEVIQAYHANQDTVLASTRRMIEFDRAIGDTADALKQTLDLYHQGNASLAEATQAYRDNQETVHKTNQQDILYYTSIGDTAGALKLVTDEYHNGYDSLQQLTDAYNANKDAVEKTMQQDLAFYMSTGQFGQALSTLTSQITQGVTDSQSKVTIDYLTGNAAALKADTDSAIAHREAQDALTSATWDATYATASAATQSQMRSSLASPMISQQSTVQGAESAVFTAQLGVIAARSAVQISLMQAEVTATNDLAGIVSAQAGVAKAQGDKLLAGINDQIPLMNDNHAIAEDLKSGNAQQLQIDREQLLIDRTTAQMNQVVASWQITLAEDSLKMARDKMMVDEMNAAAAYAVAVDNLQIAQDNVAVVQAQSQIQIDQLSVQTDISTSLGSVIDYLTMIDGDLQNLQAAQDQMQSDQSTLAGDTSNQNFVNMSGQGILAGDTLGIASDQANSQAAQQAYELQIAQYKVELNSFQLQQKDSATNAQGNAALLAELQLLRNMIVNVNSPAGRTVRAAGIGGTSFARLQNSFAASAYTTQLPMGLA